MTLSLVCPVLHELWGDRDCRDGAQVRGASRPDSKFIDGAPRLVAGVREVDGIDSFFPSLLLLLFDPRKYCWDKAALSKLVLAGARRKERWRLSHPLSQHGAQFLRRPRGMHCLAANSRLSKNAWYTFSVFVESGGGNLSTDSPARRQKRFQ